MIKKILPVLLCALIVGVLAWAGHRLLFSLFMLYDDEGYVLVSLRDFGLHGSLYNRVFSQYGPAFYLIYDTLHRLLHFAWTNTTGRWITLFNWTGTVVFCALLVRRARGSWPLVFCVLAEGFSFLWIMSREPMHPGSTITLVVAAAAWLGWEMLHAGRINGFALVIGAMGALLALIKINVGVFLILSALFWFVLSQPTDRRHHRHLLLCILGVLLPLVLMNTLLADRWVRIFVVFSALSITAVVLGAAPVAQLRPAGPRTWAWFVGTGIAATVLIILLMLPRSTSLAELWEGVLVAPLHHPSIYSFGPRWRSGTLWMAGTVVALLLLASRRPEDARVNLLLAWIKIAAGAAYAFGVVRNLDIGQGIQALSYGVPMAGLFAWPLDRKNPDAVAGNQARAWIALLLVFQCWHAFPVAGSQLNWGTFLWVPLMALGFEDAVRVAARSFTPKLAAVLRIAMPVLLTLLAVHLTRSFYILSNLAREGEEAIGEPGAEQIYLSPNYSSALRVLTTNARAHGDVLISLPGSYSFNLWSGVDTPSLANVTHWFSLLTDEQQEADIRRLDAAARPVFIIQHNILADLIDTGVHPSGPLMEYLRKSFHRSFAIEGYSFWVRNGRSIAPLATGTLTRLPEPGSNKLQLTLTLSPHAGKIARVELWTTLGITGSQMTLDATQTTVALTPLNLDGTPSGSPVPATWPWVNDRVERVTLTFTPPPSLPPPNTIEVILYDTDGHRVTTARILPPNGLELPPENRMAAPAATPVP